MRGVLGVDFGKIPPIELKYCHEVIFFYSKVPFIIGRFQFKIISLHTMHVECLVWSFRKFPRNEEQILP